LLQVEEKNNMRGTPIIGVVLVLISGQAHALCKDEVQELQPRIERFKNIDQARYGVAKKWSDLGLIEGTTGDEMKCRTYLIRAQRALQQTVEETNPKVRGPVAPIDPTEPSQKFTPPGSLGPVAGPQK
jgi:hypothetical protein